jgi:sigma-B regulation protein RsbU (phosphoserine phosphatase)
MAAVQTGFHMLAADPLDLTELVERLNRSMCERSGGGRHMITAFIGELGMGTRTLTWINAGHNPPILVQDNGTLEKLAGSGLPLGAFITSRYESQTTQLDPGSTLYVYTDGVIEAVNESGSEYGEERLVQLLTGLRGIDAAGRLKTILASVDQFASAAAQYDDITCLVLRVRGRA